jgi:pimeloyl-ACP methyl ester carboxylesterase
VPGLNNTRMVWDGVVAALGPAADCVALDCPPLDTVEAVAEALLDVLPDRFFLAGFSFGGYVALAMLERAPDRVQGLALVNTSARADTDAQRATRGKSIALAQSGEHETLMASQTALVFHPSSLSDAAMMQARATMVRDYGAQRFVAHLRACMARPDRNALLAAATCPVLVATASDDRVVPTALQKALAHSLPGVRYAEIPDAGHMLPMEQPAALAAAILAWLAPAHDVRTHLPMETRA